LIPLALLVWMALVVAGCGNGCPARQLMSG
jgi:hypothetical protein